MTLLAHSAKPERGVREQTYGCHVAKVVATATENARRMLAYHSGDSGGFQQIVRVAAVYHDLGKLDEKNQIALQKGSEKKLPVNHVDAGTRHLYRDLSWPEAALLVYAHHIGLISVSSEEAKGEDLFLRDPNVADRTNDLLRRYLSQHEGVTEVFDGGSHTPRKLTTMERRLALSCLVDADHGDTARHYGDETLVQGPPTRWQERIAALDEYVSDLAGEPSNSPQSDLHGDRFRLRNEIYHACCELDLSRPIRSCDAPVGSGKTTAVMAHLLRIAQIKNLRHIFVVLPYTNIINQSVKVYRNSLVLPGENPEEIVVAHHHQADFSELDLRYLTTLWKAPIVVTTAVQFFETLAHHEPSRLRKLHELPGSGVFVDEAHAAIPAYMWPQMWLWFKELGRNWNCHFVLASGSLAKFWELREFAEPIEEIHDIVPHALREQAVEIEERRITPRRHEAAFNRQDLQEFVLSKPGPRLVILNTVQSAAVIAHELRRGGSRVLHLSTALCPVDRDRIVECVKRLLQFQSDWALVATSCVEAGLDFSFRTAFRESCSAASLIQVGGRVNRHGLWESGEVWDFRVHHDGILTGHPAFDASRRVLDDLFDKQEVETLSPTELVTEALRREVMNDPDRRAEEIKKCEREPDYPRVSELCKVIKSDTRLVVIDPVVIQTLESGEKVSPVTLQRNSVQLWSTKIDQLSLSEIAGSREIYKWKAPYDPDFLGIMAGLLPLIYGKEEALVI